MTRPEERLRALRPAVPDEQGWATSTAGRAAFARVLAAAEAGGHADAATDAATDATDTATGAGSTGSGTDRPRWWRRRRFVLPGVAIGIGVAVAGSVAFAGAGRDAVGDGNLACASTADLRSDLYVIGVEPDTPVTALPGLCHDAWNTGAAKLPRPVSFVICVFPVSRDQTGGGLVGVPSATSLPVDRWPTACQRAGFDPYDG